MKNILLGITTAGLLFTACNNSSQPDKDPSLAVPSSTEVSGTPAISNPAASETINSQVTPMPTTGTPGVGSLTGLNPEHGQPNHRCDIAVGAPLSSPAPAAGAVTAPVSAPMPSTVQPTMPQPVMPTSGATSGKINPAHGQPGHSCAVAVGAALP